MRSVTSRIARSFWLGFLVIVAVAGPAAHAQQQPTDSNLDTGIKPYETYDSAKENVDIASGNLNVQIPLVHLPGRHGHDLNLELTYNGQNWSPVAQINNPENTDYISIGWEYSHSSFGIGSTGWQLNIPVLYASAYNSNPNGAPQSNYSNISCWRNFTLVMGDGRKFAFENASVDCHQTSVSSTGGQGGGTTTTVADPSDDYPVDTNYWSSGNNEVVLDLRNFASGIAVARFKDGSQIQFPMGVAWRGTTTTGGMSTTASAMVDTNGNVISIDPYGNMTDTDGRAVSVSNNSGSSSETLSYKNSNGTSEQITLNYAAFPTTLNPSFSNPTVGENITSVSSAAIGSMLSSIVLPDGLSYTFQYNEYGELLEITYPTGGYTRYVYQASPNSQYEWTSNIYGYADSRKVVEKDECPSATVAAGATTPSGYVGDSVASTCTVAENKTTYTRTLSGDQTNAATVVDPMRNSTIYTFGDSIPAYVPSNPPPTALNIGLNPSMLETSRAVYQGSSTLLETVNTTHSGSLITSQTTVLPNGSQSQVVWNYNSTQATHSYTVTDDNTQIQGNEIFEADNLNSKQEYGYGSGSPGPLVRTTAYQYVTVNRVNGTDYTGPDIFNWTLPSSKTVTDGRGNQIAQTTYEYDNYKGGITASGAVQHSSSFSTTYTTRGNVTATNQWRSSDGATLTTRNYQFDDAGNVLVRQDPMGHSTQTSYADSAGNSSCEPSSGNMASYPSAVTNALGQVVHYTWNSCTGTMASYSDPNQKTTSFGYDVMDRRVLASYPDTGQTCLQYSDAPNTVCQGANQSSGALPITITTTRAMNSSGENYVSTVTLDGVSRQVQTQVRSDPSGTDTVKTTYDGNGNVASVTNPYRSTSDPTYGITQYQYDALGRKLIEVEQDGSLLRWCYDGTKANASQTNCSSSLGSQSINGQPYIGSSVDHTDEVGRWWQNTTDALGRLIKVMEPNPSATANTAPTLETDYAYDGLDNLIEVDQWGGPYGSPGDRQRLFTYDSLSELLTAQNPENGLVCYGTWSGSTVASGTCAGGYDMDGDVLARTDARGITTHYGYDSLNRLTSKTYSDNTPSVTWNYDSSVIANAVNVVGRVTKETEWQGSTQIFTKFPFQYDSMGRVTFVSGCLAINCYDQSTGISYWQQYGYDLIGNVTYSNFWTSDYYNFPGFSLNRTINAANQVTSLIQSQPAYFNGVRFQNAFYDPMGHMTSWTGALSDSDSAYYDNRGRVTAFSALRSGEDVYSYNKSYNPDGTLLASSDSVNGTSTYSYDNLARLQTANSSWAGNTTFSYDNFGNRLSQSGGVQTFIDTSSTTTNRLDCTPVTPAAEALGSCYDQSGNMIQDIPNGVTTPHSYTYDAEGRLSGITDEGVQFYYDGEGHRVEIAGGGNPRSYLLDELGNYFVAFPATARSQFELQIYDHGMYYGSGGYPNHFTYTDPLNTARFILEAGTNTIITCRSMPFGDAQTCANEDAGDNVHFTGKERDTESGLDYFDARYFGSTMGRFISPDYSDDEDDDYEPQAIPYYNPTNPQSLNLYSYVLNNPLTGIDSDGHDCVVQSRTSDTSENVTVSSGNCDNVSVGDGQTKTYIAGTVDVGSIQSDRAGGISVGYTPYSGGGGVADLSAAPVPDSPGLAYNWGNNAQGYQTIGGWNNVVEKGTAIGIGVYAAAFGGAAALDALSATGGASEGIGLTEHAAQRLAERGITSDQAKAAIQAAKEAGNVITKIGKYGTPQSIYTANGIRVVVEEAGANAGKIITAFFK